jgi:hypothetical protein
VGFDVGVGLGAGVSGEGIASKVGFGVIAGTTGDTAGVVAETLLIGSSVSIALGVSSPLQHPVLSINAVIESTSRNSFIGILLPAWIINRRNVKVHHKNHLSGS